MLKARFTSGPARRCRRATRNVGRAARLGLLGALFLFLSAPGLVEAQSDGSLVGIVRDEVNSEAIGEAVVALVEHGREVETGNDGAFRFLDLPPGPVTLRVTGEGYGTVVEQVQVGEDPFRTLEVFLPRMENILQELLVTGERSDPATGHSEYQVQGSAHHRTALDVLQGRVPGLMVGSATGDLGKGSQIRLRGVGTIEGTNLPSVYLDGVRIDSGTSSGSILGDGFALNVLQTIPADQVESVRVLSGPASTSQYQDGANGVIVIETVRGGGSQDDEGDEEG